LTLAAWKTIVSESVELFHKYERGHLEQGHQRKGGGESLRFLADTALAEQDRLCPLVSTSKTL